MIWKWIKSIRYVDSLKKMYYEAHKIILCSSFFKVTFLRFPSDPVPAQVTSNQEIKFGHFEEQGFPCISLFWIEPTSKTLHPCVILEVYSYILIYSSASTSTLQRAFECVAFNICNDYK